MSSEVVAALRVVADHLTRTQTPPPTRTGTTSMNTREMLASFLTFGNEAARQLTHYRPGTSEWETTANGVITSFTIAALAAELRAVDLDRADELVDLIAQVLDDSETAAAMLLQWGHTLNRGEDFRLTEIPEPDERGRIITPEESAQLDKQATAALTQLAQVDQAHAATLHAKWQNPEHPTDATDVLREASVAIQNHQRDAQRSSTTYTEHHEPRRGDQ